ncbi:MULTISPECIES: phage holin family protein [unclassified Sphingomonas]|jgi:Putative Actinobacterial Holin-X, holin superfamily III|uniref:phage holin family protein n=1 Tax=unclassified Sphingomonas TaxID=196159 RepID=UPI000E104BA4|nr:MULTISPECIES: phage holin family protein [unclassified Sphingomonas]AXJ94199.1 phage holin family protein [Sphingomonas sp. FARSPH]
MVEEPGVATLVGQLVEDTRNLASAEIALAKARVGERVAAYRTAAIFFATAGVLALAALVALLVGLIMTLTPLIGPGIATGIVVIGVLAIAAILGLVGKARLAPAKVTR